MRTRLILVDDFVLVGEFLGSDDAAFYVKDEKNGATYVVPREEVVRSNLCMYT
jgi:hypothetical protein